MQRPEGPQHEKHAARRPMEGAFRSFVGEVLRIKRGVLAAPGAAACDIVQQRVLEGDCVGSALGLDGHHLKHG